MIPRRPAPRRHYMSASQRRTDILMPRVLELWTRYVFEEQPPHLDRWLSRTLSGLGRLSRDDRLWIGARLTDAVRYAWLALGCHESYNRPFSVHDMSQSTRDLQKSWQRLGELDAEDVFFWVFLRLHVDGRPAPRMDEPRTGSLACWHRINAGLGADRSLAAGLLKAGLPSGLAPLLKRRVAMSDWTGDEVDTFLGRQSNRPPLWLRLRDLADRDAVIGELKKAGFRTQPTGNAIAAVGDLGVYELACIKDGRVEVQDLASQHIGLALSLQPGQFLWDACCGGGGKSLQAAAIMQGTGAVYATDLREAPLRDLKKRAKRGGFASIRAYPWDGESTPDFGRAVAKRGGFERVLVDAPCSGSGTWRRNPDGRLRTEPWQLVKITETQSRLLDLAAGSVKPGGLLVYATCSWFCEENEDVTSAFAAKHPEFELVEQRLHGSPQLDADTTFSAVFKRRDTD